MGGFLVWFGDWLTALGYGGYLVGLHLHVLAGGRLAVIDLFIGACVDLLGWLNSGLGSSGL